jgi:hypothetical protein
MQYARPTEKRHIHLGSTSSVRRFDDNLAGSSEHRTLFKMRKECSGARRVSSRQVPLALAEPDSSGLPGKKFCTSLS